MNETCWLDKACGCYRSPDVKEGNPCPIHKPQAKVNLTLEVNQKAYGLAWYVRHWMGRRLEEKKKETNTKWICIECRFPHNRNRFCLQCGGIGQL